MKKESLTRRMIRVLIETYWNVNFFRVLPSGSVAAVLIETYWNVNSTKGMNAYCTTSINRNILECKFLSMVPLFLTSLLVLIETYWNVNSADL